MRFIVEPSREIEISAETEILVLGGGPAGIATQMARQIGIPPKRIDREQLQTRLIADGAFVGEIRPSKL